MAAKGTNLSFYVPGADGTTQVDRRVQDLGTYLKRVAKDYPEGTTAVYYTGHGTLQFRRHVRGQFELIRRTVGP